MFNSLVLLSELKWISVANFYAVYLCCEIWWNFEFFEKILFSVTYLQWRTHILKLLWRQQVYEHRNCSIPNWWGQIKTIGGSFYFDISMALQSHHDRVSLGKTFFNPLKLKDKVRCVFPMVIVSILPHAEFGSNDHREDAPHFTR